MKIGIAKLGCVIVVLSLTFGLAQHSYAQARASSKTSDISINFLGLLLRDPFELGYEFKASPTSSWQLRGYYWFIDANYSAFGFGAAYRIYIADSRAITGLSVAPGADIFFFRPSDASLASATTFMIGGDLAYKWIFDQFSVEPIVELRIGIGGSSGIGSSTGALARIGANLGYAF